MSLDAHSIERLVARSVEDAPGGFMVCLASKEAEDLILYASDSLVALFDCDDQDDFMRFSTGRISGLGDPYEVNRMFSGVGEQVAEGHRHFAVTTHIITKTGRRVAVGLSGLTVQDSELGLVAIVTFDTDVVAFLPQDDDPLTGLSGMRSFLSRAKRSMDEASRSARESGGCYVFFDIHNFKLVNAALGVASGDELLVKLAELLRETFPSDFVARFADDHFAVLTFCEDVEKRVAHVHDAVTLLHPSVDIELKAGIYPRDLTVDPSVSCDRAKLACDSIAHAVDVYQRWYDPSMSAVFLAGAFAANSLDEALAAGDIKVYYQPVIRSITGNLCGLEALVRWDDPDHELLSPASFIPALETSKQIHKLDCFVVREICRNYRRVVDSGAATVPVSFNLSRLDFILCDVFQEVEDAVMRYDVPRDMIRVEITESMLATDAERVRGQMERFRAAGYQVWMDDFGSGYSSLNLMKDNDFDAMKIDMEFLSNFNDKSRGIIESVVAMAKRLGVQTLAEGVETQEEFCFLRDIGCEKVQGYLFGKPMPYERCMARCEELGLEVESRSWRHYYDAIGQVDFMTDQPLSLLEYDGESFRVLFGNEGFYALALRGRSKSAHKVESILNMPDNPVYRRFREAVERQARTGRTEFITFIDRGRYFSATFSLVADNKELRAFVNSWRDVSDSEEARVRGDLDETLRNLYLLYDSVLLVDRQDDTVTSLLSGMSAAESGDRTVSGIDAVRTRYALEKVFPEDRSRYLSFTDPETMQERCQEAVDGKVMAYFRTRGRYGSYAWKSYTILALHELGPEGSRFMLCIEDATINNKEALSVLLNGYGLREGSLVSDDPSVLTPELLWNNLLLNSRVNYFWKDRKRRFLGASRAFLDYYGFLSVDEILGKTDEDMGWHVDNDPYRSDELAVLNEGKHIFFAPGKCIIRGVVHNIRASKAPIYKNGKIVGLLGYFVDLDTSGFEIGGNDEATITDRVTGVTNARGLWEAAIDYTEDYYLHATRFAVIALVVPEYLRELDEYGRVVSDALLATIARRIVGRVGVSGTVARLSNAEFVVIVRYGRAREVDVLARALCKDISEIHEAQGHDCTVTARYGVALEDEAATVNELVDVALAAAREKVGRGSSE
ncbi:EAL domain-containing protein [Parafannyhessea umbonata]|uniref:Diguanylate cyclase (GGDEF) domain-containing protein n=1 Tax=Parafannyhessea umbonata TaxID=604330 RepID=A0A1H9N5T1_9ACTN|nr:EAL domain-containing protein [Parafannyhessea umbonata]SER30763.1 diguanylate cyclase (GGDEF) domain-containing protein [Parafannyhessea umbonata]